MTGSAEPSMLTHIIAQLRSLESRARRRAVWVAVAVPACLDTESVKRILRQALRAEDGSEPEVELSVSPDGRPRLLTVDFELREAL